MWSDEFYLEGTVGAFINWLEQYLEETLPKQPYPKGAGLLYLQPAQREFNLMGELMLAVPGVFLERPRPLAQLPWVMAFTILPVGCGSEVVVRRQCSEPAVERYFREISDHISANWRCAAPLSSDLAPRTGEQVLAQLRLGARLDEFEAELKHLVSRYQAANVHSAAVDERRGWLYDGDTYINRQRQPIDRKSQRSWSIGLHLLTSDQQPRGIRDSHVEVEATQLGGQYPLFLEVAVAGHLYREGFRFCEVFLTHCQGLWNLAPADFAYGRWRAEQIPTVAWPWPGLALSEPEPVGVGEPARLEAALASPEPAKAAPEPVAPATSLPEAVSRDPAPPAIPAWESIPDHLWDRQALKLWWEGRSCPYIGKAIHQSSKTVLNRLSTLRKLYGTDIVPMNDQRKERDTWM